MATLKDRFLNAEEDFVIAITQGEKALFAFEKRWEALLQEVDRVVQTTGLEDDVAPLVHSTAMRIAILAETSSDLYETTATLTSQLVEELDGMMSELSIHDLQLPRSPSHHRSPSSHPANEHSDSVSPCRKRSRSSSQCSDGRDLVAPKRTRTASYSQNDDVEYSPATPLSRSLLSPSPPTPNHFRLPGDHSSISLKRKRHVSETDTTPPPSAKRLYVGPRLHAVSDSYRPPRTSTADSLCLPSSTDTPAVSIVAPPESQPHQTPAASTTLANVGAIDLPSGPLDIDLPSGPLDIDRLLDGVWDGISSSHDISFVKNDIFVDLPDASWYPSSHTAFSLASPASSASSTSSPSCPSTPSDSPSLSLGPTSTFRLLDPEPEDGHQESSLAFLSDTSYQSTSSSMCSAPPDAASTSFTKTPASDDPWTSLLHLLEPLHYQPDCGDSNGLLLDTMTFTCFDPYEVDGTLFQDPLLTLPF